MGIEFGHGPWGAAYPIHLRGAVAPDLIADLRQGVLDVVALPPYEGRFQSSKSFQFKVVSMSRFPVCEALLQLLVLAFRRSRMFDLATELLGPRFVFLTDHCAVRHQTGMQDGQTLDFHFDAAFIGSDWPALNFWVALDDVGVHAPSLTFINYPKLRATMWKQFRAQHHQKGGGLLDPNKHAQHLRAGLGDHLVSNVYTPSIEAGDCLLFDTATLHSTLTGSDFNRDRVSIEYRICPIDRVPAAYRARGGALAEIVETENGYTFKIDRF
jgi:hypothetical protein